MKREAAKLIEMPHEVHRSTCYVDGLYDLLASKGAKYDYFLLPIAGGMASFAYLKFKMSKPPCMVYWGNSPKYLLQELSEVIGFTQEVSEGRSFKNEFPKMKKHLDNGEPVMVGALDMYYLPYYPELYQKEHIPIHYVLLVGYDDEKQVVYAHDCTWSGVQEVPYPEFEKAMNVNVPGMSKRNTYRVFNLSDKMPSEIEVAERGFTRKAERMLKPKMSMFGIPAMRKLSEDIVNWEGEDCFKHMVAYAGLTPPLVASDLSHNDGMRFELARLLKEMGEKYRRTKWVSASLLFVKSGEFIIDLCRKAVNHDGRGCAETLKEIADTEEEAYKILME